MASSSSASGVLSAAVFRALSSSVSQNQMVEFSRYAQLATVAEAADGSVLPKVRSVNIRGSPEELPAAKAGDSARGMIKFSTDARSAKIAEFAAAARRAKDGRAVVELCWFFPVTREQFRLRCEVQLIFTEGVQPEVAASPASPSAVPTTPAVSGAFPAPLVRSDAAAQQLHVAFWKAHSEDARQLFEIAHPGTLKKRAAEGDLDRFEAQPLSDSKPSQHFVTVLLLPTRADYLKLPRPGDDDKRGQITRVQHHESTLQPNRHQRRWLHVRDEQSGEWTATELNP